MSQFACKIDHLIYVAHDIPKAIQQFSNIFGVTPRIGGRHLQWGTWNALFSLNNNSYFEIVGPDPLSDIRPTTFLCGTGYEGLITYVAHIPDHYNSMQEFKNCISQSYDIGDVIESQRTLINDESKVLKWTLGWNNKYGTNNLFDESHGILPIFIDWKQTNVSELHPSNTSPDGCELLSMKCTHPDMNNDYGFILNDLFKMEDKFEFEKAKNNGNKIEIQCLIKCKIGNVTIHTIKNKNNGEVISNEIYCNGNQIDL